MKSELLAVVGGEILQGDQFAQGKNLIIQNGRIAEITSRKLPKQCRCIDATGKVVVPGFIDLHLHCDSSESTDPNQHLEKISVNHARFGTTRFLATYGTSSIEKFKFYAKALESSVVENGAKVLGVHLEGPFLNSSRAGAQPREYIYKPSREILNEILGAFGKKLRLMTLAPELVGMEEIIRLLRKNRVLVSIGHSNATYDEARRGIQAGIRYGTHLFNQMRGLHHRELGAVGAILLDPRVFAELIVDGIHLNPLMVKLIARVKELEKIVLATDCFTHLDHDAKEPPRLPHGTLSGSALSLRRAILNLVKFTGLDLAKAIHMATLNPAKALGVDRDYGSLEIGKSADVVLMDKKLNVKMTMVGGKIVFSGQRSEKHPAFSVQRTAYSGQVRRFISFSCTLNADS